MNKETTAVTLGDEYDNELRDTLRTVITKHGGVSVDKSWGVGGSQEIEALAIRLGSDLITIEAETFVGLTVTGPKALVEEIALQVKQLLSGCAPPDPS
jgi:hypothetical protein